jgi:hypothetical protein
VALIVDLNIILHYDSKRLIVVYMILRHSCWLTDVESLHSLMVMSGSSAHQGLCHIVKFLKGYKDCSGP